MGLDLTLHIVDGKMDSPYAFTVLALDRAGALFDEIREIADRHALPFSVPLESYTASEEAPGWAAIPDDAYGQPLKWVCCNMLLLLREHESVLTCENLRAAWAYLAELEPMTRVALYWH